MSPRRRRGGGGPPRGGHGHGIHGHRGPRHGAHGGRGSLRRRLFVWIALAMLGSALLSGLGGFFASVRDAAFAPDEAIAWVGDRFAERWDDPAARAALARETAARFSAGIVLEDATGRVLERSGPAFDARRAWRIPIERDGSRVGAIAMGFPRDARRPLRLVVGIGLFLFGLWAASGAIARRIAAPLAAAAEVADHIGEGRTSERLRLRPGAPRELGAFARALNRMAERVEAALGSQRRLLAHVSHEVRTPLGHMRLLVESGRDGVGLDRVWDELDREIDAIDDLVGELLAGERLAVHGAKKSKLDAAELAERALRRAGGDPERLVAPRPPMPLFADPTLLDRALANLLRNARDHGGGIVRLELVDEGDRVRFRVVDEGPGIEPERFARLLEGATPADAPSPRGLGLGLPLVRRIASAHGGHVELEPTTRGACVALVLPREDDA